MSYIIVILGSVSESYYGRYMHAHFFVFSTSVWMIIFSRSDEILHCRLAPQAKELKDSTKNDPTAWREFDLDLRGNPHGFKRLNISGRGYGCSRRKVQKLRDQSQYISKNVRALQYWRWACGTCCKQYHMLFYIQMAVVSTAIFFLFSPSFSFFLEIKVQIYIYFHNKCQYINQFPPKP